jgi:hypothetical protein
LAAPRATQPHSITTSTSDEVKYQHNYGYHQEDVNQSTGDMKCEKPKQPEND